MFHYTDTVYSIISHKTAYFSTFYKSGQSHYPATKSLINVFILLLKVYTYEKGFYSTVRYAFAGG